MTDAGASWSATIPRSFIEPSVLVGWFLYGRRRIVGRGVACRSRAGLGRWGYWVMTSSPELPPDNHVFAAHAHIASAVGSSNPVMLVMRLILLILRILLILLIRGGSRRVRTEGRPVR